jgi:hypothetical protein
MVFLLDWPFSQAGNKHYTVSGIQDVCRALPCPLLIVGECVSKVLQDVDGSTACLEI